MKGHYLTKDMIQRFGHYLQAEEKSENTTEKYIRDLRAFLVFLHGKEVTKEIVIRYKNKLIAENYAVRSINSMLASLNSLFTFLGWSECKVKSIKLQRQIYCPEEKELTKAEYLRLVNTTKQKGNERLNLILQTICGTGIRVSELQFITVEAAKSGETTVSLKGKTRSVFIVKDLQKKIAPLCSRAKNTVGMYFCYTNRQTHQPHQYLAGDEKAVRRCWGKSIKSISAQSAPLVRPHLLRH